MDYTPEAWDEDFENFRKAALIALLLEVAIAKLEALLAEDLVLEADDLQDWRNPDEDDCPLDGDFDSAMASAGMGTDEDYNHYDYGDYEM